MDDHALDAAGQRGADLTLWSGGQGENAAERSARARDVHPLCDQSLLALRSGLATHRRRLWFRRIVRRAWIALAVVVIAEAVLWTVARFVPLEAAPVIGLAIPVLGALGLLMAAVVARPPVSCAAPTTITPAPSLSWMMSWPKVVSKA